MAQIKSHLNTTKHGATIELKIPLQYLPEGWCATVAAKFDLSESYVSKVADGRRKNTTVFDHLLDMAEAGKKQEALRLERLANLITEPQTVTQP